MTTDEKRQQRAAVLVDLEDAQENLKHLQVKAVRMAAFLNEIADKLRRNASLKPTGNDFSLETDLANRLNPNQQDIPDFAAIQGTIEELRSTRQRIFNLEQQKSQLGNSGLSAAAS
jgi:hypothetical protein